MKQAQFLLAFIVTLFISACGGGGNSTPSSGNSIVGAPSSIIGKTVIQTVTQNDGQPNVIGVGQTITYSFIDANTILGAGLNTLPTTSWSYGLNGNVAKVNLTYGSIGWANDTWTFTSQTGGTYHSNTGLSSGTNGWHEGTFVVSNYQAPAPAPAPAPVTLYELGGRTVNPYTTSAYYQTACLQIPDAISYKVSFTSGGATFYYESLHNSLAECQTAGQAWVVANGGGGGGGGGTTPTTGQVAVWSSRATTQTGSISVTIDNVYAGGLTQYYTSTPTCGAAGTVTKTLSIGTHTISAADGTITWAPGSFTITAGGCLTYQLN